MKTFFLLCSLIASISFVQAQYVSITVTENGRPMAYHDVTVSHGDYVLGTGRTNASGYVSIYTPQLRSRSVDVAGIYENGNTTKKWSIKGKIQLDNQNSTHIKLEEIGAGMSDNMKDMEKRRDDILSRRDDLFSDNNKAINKNNSPNNNSGSISNSGGSTANAMPSSEFKRALDEIKQTSSSFKQKDMALALVKENAMSASQIKEVVSTLSSSFSQKEVAIAAYDNCTDPGNYKTVINTLSSSMMQKEVERATVGK